MKLFSGGPEKTQCRKRELRTGKMTGETMILMNDRKTGQAEPNGCADQNGRLGLIKRPLLAWYDTHKRVLPWREQPTAYRVWVSEVMLQQTRVEAVKPYFERFMKKLPDVETLAGAEEETLLKLWEGLGYYNRVKNLQKAAVTIMEEYGGMIPGDYEELLKLSGIGSYTAGAISSIAFGKTYPAVDGNVLRVLSRYRKDSREISDAGVKKQVERELSEVMPADRPGDFNQALMELGACVCLPNGAPDCGACPLKDLCMAHRDSEELDFPKKAVKKSRVIEEKTILVICDADRTVLRKRAAGGLLAGMYEFPSMDGFCSDTEVIAYLADRGLKVIRILPLAEAKHIFTHKEWHMKGYLVRVDELDRPQDGQAGGDENWIYVEPEETRENYPIPTAFSAYTRILEMKLGKDILLEE